MEAGSLSGARARAAARLGLHTIESVGARTGLRSIELGLPTINRAPAQCGQG